MAEYDPSQEAAASKIAAIQKGKAERRRRRETMEAAIKVQAIQRGRAARKPAAGTTRMPTEKERQAMAQARAHAAAPKTLAQLGLKCGLPIDPVPGLRFLTFYSWWHESGTKRYMEICFDLQTELFQARSPCRVC